MGNNSAFALAAEKKMLLITEEWPPYNYSEAGELKGFSVEIVRRIVKIMDKQYEIKILPSMRASRIINTRPRTIMFSMFRTTERESSYKWIGPLGDGALFFYKRRDNQLTIRSIEDLKKVPRIGTRHNGLIPHFLSAQGFKNLDRTATSSLQVYKKLLAGRSDIAISDTDLGTRYNLKLLGVDMQVLEKIPIPIFRSDLYIAASKDITDEEIQEWQSALDTLKINGEYDKIFQEQMRSPAIQANGQ